MKKVNNYVALFLVFLHISSCSSLKTNWFDLKKSAVLKTEILIENVDDVAIIGGCGYELIADIYNANIVSTNQNILIYIPCGERFKTLKGKRKVFLSNDFSLLKDYLFIDHSKLINKKENSNAKYILIDVL